MKLKYKILWIEDNPISIRRDKNKIIEYITDLGFECIDDDEEKDIMVINSFDEFEEKIGYEKTADYDLLLVDLDLGKKPTKDEGESIIRKIRDEKVYSEIVFYSSQYEELQSKLRGHFVEGIFTSSREELADKVESIIAVTIKKTQDVNNLRGLIMAEVAELDRIKKRIIEKFSKEADSNFKKYIKEDVFSKIKKDLESLSCLVKVEDSECSHDEINLEELQKNFFYDTFKKSRTIYKIKRKKCNHVDFKHDDYKKDVIDKRNVLAHQKEDEDASGKFLLYPNGSKLEFTAEHCIQIRKDIKKYKKDLEDIEKAI